jgi:hypothetical protein
VQDPLLCYILQQGQVDMWILFPLRHAHLEQPGISSNKMYFKKKHSNKGNKFMFTLQLLCERIHIKIVNCSPHPKQNHTFLNITRYEPDVLYGCETWSLTKMK